MSKNRLKIITFRVSNAESKALAILAKREDRGRSELIREMIREGIQKRGIQNVGLVDLLGFENGTFNEHN